MSAIATDQERLADGTGGSGPVKRPIAVTLVGVFALIVGSSHAVNGLVVLVHGGDANTLAEGALDLALGVLAVAIGGAALQMRRWAWAAFMTWAVIGLTHQILRHFFYGHPNYLAMALDAAAVLVLTPLDVQIAFGIRPPRNVILDDAARNPIGSN